jgi:hypothetical protein
MQGTMTMAKGRGGKKPVQISEPSIDMSSAAGAQKPATTTTRLFEKHANLLTELARLSELESVAVTFEKHFGAQLENLVIRLTRERLKALEDDAAKKS